MVMLSSLDASHTFVPGSHLLCNIRLQHVIIDLPTLTYFLHIVQYNDYDRCDNTTTL